MKLLSLNSCYVTPDVASVTSYDSQTEVNPESVGLSLKQRDRIWQAAELLYKTGASPAISICIRKKGHIVLNRAIGHARGNGPEDTLDTPKVLATPDTRICLFSASKVVTAMLIHLLDEMGEIDLLDPISNYIPEYGVNGKRNATIYHLLAHRGGIPSLPKGTDPKLLFNPDAALDLLYKAKPIAPSGYRAAYHALTAGYILGEIIKRVTGKDCREFMAEKISIPMDMPSFNFGLAPEHREQVALNYSTGVKPIFVMDAFLRNILGGSMEDAEHYTNDPQFMDTICPAGNIFATAEQASRFFQMLLDGGRYQDKQLFDPKTIRRATIEVSKPEIDAKLLLPMRYAMGPMLGAKPVGLYGINTPNAFGHLGYTCIFCWADPDRDISASVLTTGKFLLGAGLPAILNLIATISTQCKVLAPAERRRFS
ncbi:serine hydrolase domain-containing protein [Agitococcus lubricus]|uniref:CubicO group peptidase (Beta-lactamase class C family) n=1 Tax=Agitococcus lubricus TaxID=1077255 RepID=A0A2T5IZ04_9GAMM|nr:serine hydrolase domain-containing protein [Agitococcus lubricus]PTQ89242.1 CubicO group peptidase (beta-lactamase class C family) [Agitococcus lubricus]